MFRKEYKQANDNIKVDEALLERTLEAAFAEKPKRKVHYYRSFAPVAAALLVVIGVSVAHPKLVEKPEIEQTAMFTVSPTLNPEGNMSIDAVSEPVSTPAPQNTVIPKKASATAMPEPVTNASAVVEDVAVANEKNDSEPANADASAATENDAVVMSVARAGGGEPEVYKTADVPEEGFTQISCKFLDGTEEYVYGNETGKTFTITVMPAEAEKLESGISIEKNGKLYIFSSENMTEAEIMEVFETLDI